MAVRCGMRVSGLAKSAGWMPTRFSSPRARGPAPSSRAKGQTSRIETRLSLTGALRIGGGLILPSDEAKQQSRRSAVSPPEPLPRGIPSESMISQYAAGTVRASTMPEASRVLVVEDDAGVAGGIVRGLRGAGFDVELATDGVEGTRKALERRFDAIVLDLMLPGQNGLEVLEQLKG